MDIKSLDQYLDYHLYLWDPQELVDGIISRAKLYLPADQLPLIQKAYDYAKAKHEWQVRLSGEAYVVHVVKATEFLMEINPDVASIQTCLLHDVIEDTEVTQEDIQKEFGEEIAVLCEWLVKVSKIKYKGEDRHIETLKKTFLAMANDLRVIFIKLCDRIHNIQTLQYHPNPVKIEKIAQETLKIYVPIARRLGLYYFQLYLENGSFRHLNEPEFTKIFNYLKKYFKNEEKYTNKGIEMLTNMLHKEGIKEFTIKGRIKSPYRIYEKLEKKYQASDIWEVMDLLAFRVITTSVADCYMILWIIHKYYTPLIKKIKDYIAVPKSNWYQSIHTTVLGMFQFPTEIQIRTYEMDEIAEYGVAAHFAYSEHNKSISVGEYQGQWIRTLHDLVNTYKETDDKERFKNELRIEVLNKRMYLYTPKGDVIELSNWGTVLDFAFAVHSEIGLRFKSAIVNGQIKPINFIANTWDVISINTFKNRYSANKHWLEFLTTVNAKSVLNRFLKTQQKDEILKKHTDELNVFLEKYNLPKYEWSNDKISKTYTKAEFEKKMVEVLDKKLTYSQLIKAVYPKERDSINKTTNAGSYQQSPAPKEVSSSSKVLVDWDRLFNYTLCPECNPIVGQKIIAKAGRDGIKVHTTDCKSLKTISLEKLLEAHRDGAPTNNYGVSIELVIFNKYSNLLDIMTIFSDLRLVILQVSIKNNGDGTSSIFLESEFKNPARIAFLVNSLKKYDDSIKINKERVY